MRRFIKGEGLLNSLVTFCPDCMRAQIREFGFGYFKACWLCSDFCVQHHQALQNVDYPLSNPYDYLQKYYQVTFLPVYILTKIVGIM